MMKTPRVHVIATQHLDVAWLWPRAPYGEEFMRQCFERAVELIEADPGVRFVFSRSTAWSFRVVEQKYPALFERIRECVARGAIELCGGEWVEPDHLIPDGESLVRQCALGQWYFLDKFSYPVRWMGFSVDRLSPFAAKMVPFLPTAFLGQEVLFGQSMLLYLSIVLLVFRVIR